MDRESTIELQKIDCNCNDCVFMNRDTDEFKRSLDRHHEWQLDYFNVLKTKRIEKANEHRIQKGDLEMWDKLLTEAENMKFQFDKKECYINYGTCAKFEKPVSFIPNVCQLDTQNCFKHRRE